nr:fibroblast growth factor 22 [Anolis sagrei ordinatus]
MRLEEEDSSAKRGLDWMAPGVSSNSSWRRGVRSYPHLQGDVRWRRLYSANHFFLRIDGDGKVDGTRQKENPNNIMEIRSVNVGTVAVRAIHSGYYLAMDGNGRIYGTKAYGPDCKFQERIEENGYNTYASLLWRHRGRPMFLSLNARGSPRWGTKTRRQQPSAHFLPLLVF